MAAVKLSKEVVKSFVDSFDTVLFDCDGVLWTGSKPVQRAAETINFFKAHGKRVFYVTNNSTKTRPQYLTKLTGLGFQANEVKFKTPNNSDHIKKIQFLQEEIATSGYLVASYLQSLNFNKTVYLVGSKGLAEELNTHGINCTPPGPNPMVTSIQEYLSEDIQLDNNVGAVVVGFDEYISYPKILKAANYLKDPDCLFLATNSDETFPMDKPMVVPGTGVVVAAIQTACSPRKPQIFGKPFPHMFEAISKRANIDPSRTLMVGDRCNTDISFGKSCGLKTLLVLTGVTSLKQLQDFEAEQECNLIPDFYTEQLGDILTLLE